jgi:SAM-dependent methyltransferase
MKISPGPSSGFTEIRQAIRNKYAAVSVSAAGRFQYPVGKEGPRALGYDADILNGAPEQFFESSCPVGNPFSLGMINPGSAVLDYGCGAGFDMYVASRLMGDHGRVCGIDLTEEMAERARRNLALAGIPNFEVQTVDSETIPYDDYSFDVVISNGVINLSPCKQTLFREIKRVLKPGGKLQIADIILEQALPAGLSSAESWSQ